MSTSLLLFVAGISVFHRFLTMGSSYFSVETSVMCYMLHALRFKLIVFESLFMVIFIGLVLKQLPLWYFI